MVLALFHTVFNVLGVVLLWPFTQRLVTWLQGLYRTEEEDESQPKYLDETVIATPALAMNALLKEINRIGVLARHTVVTALMYGEKNSSRLQNREKFITQLVETVGQFIIKTQKLPLVEKDASTLSQTLRITHYLTEATNLAMGVVGMRKVEEALADNSLKADLIGYRRTVINWLVKIELRSSEMGVDRMEMNFSSLEKDYQNLKERLLRRGATGRIGLHDLDHLLDLLSLLHRILERHLKALRILIPLLEERELSDLPKENMST